MNTTHLADPSKELTSFDLAWTPGIKIPGAELAMVLAQCRGQDNALTAWEIGRRLPGKPEAREVRRQISELQDRWPFLVCAVAGGGYFVPQEFDEVRTYYIFLSGLEERAIAKRKGYKTNAKRLGYPL